MLNHSVKAKFVYGQAAVQIKLPELIAPSTVLKSVELMSYGALALLDRMLVAMCGSNLKALRKSAKVSGVALADVLAAELTDDRFTPSNVAGVWAAASLESRVKVDDFFLLAIGESVSFMLNRKSN